MSGRQGEVREFKIGQVTSGEGTLAFGVLWHKEKRAVQGMVYKNFIYKEDIKHFLIQTIECFNSESVFIPIGGLGMALDIHSSKMV